MSCPTCDHSVELFGIVQGTQIFHCPRCGTVLEVEADGVTAHVPKLVERCREFEQEVKDESPIADVTFGVIISILRRLGIAESINKPEDRPT